MLDRYTYEGSGGLRNTFGITDPSAAHEVETRVSHQRLVELSEHTIPGELDLAHLQVMHRAIYRDLWDWAGEIRTVDTGTANTGLAHCRPEFIEDQALISQIRDLPGTMPSQSFPTEDCRFPACQIWIMMVTSSTPAGTMVDTTSIIWKDRHEQTASVEQIATHRTHAR